MATTFYNSNPNLKSVGVAVEYTPDQLQEYIKCKEDPIYFIKKYVKIISLDRGLVPFELYDYQVRFITALHENRMVVTLMPRQSGKTICIAAYLTWYILFNDAKTVAILANKASAAREVMSRVQLIYENVPLFLQQGVNEWNKGSIALENNSKVFTAATTSSGIRGKSVNLLVVDEMAIIPNTVAEEFFTATYPTISSGKTTKIILASTPLGLNHFWKFWTEAEQGINGFVPVRVSYHEHPDRDEKWAEEQRKLLGELKFQQEVACSFLGSASTLISASVIQRLAAQRPIYELDGIAVYDPPFKGGASEAGPAAAGSYVMTVDTSEGVGGDYSTFSIIRIDQMPYKLVARYRNNSISPLVFPNVIYKWASEYNQAMVLIEVNKSEQVPYILHNELEYENILYVGRNTKQGQRVGGAPYIPGVKMDKRVKRLGCSVFKDLVEQSKLLISDIETIAEISTFIEDGRGSYSADSGKHDDLVMPLVMFGWLVNDPYFQELTNTNLRNRLFEQRLDHIEQSVLPIGFYNDGTEEVTGETWVDYTPA